MTVEVLNLFTTVYFPFFFFLFLTHSVGDSYPYLSSFEDLTLELHVSAGVFFFGGVFFFCFFFVKRTDLEGVKNLTTFP